MCYFFNVGNLELLFYGKAVYKITTQYKGILRSVNSMDPTLICRKINVVEYYNDKFQKGKA